MRAQPLLVPAGYLALAAGLTWPLAAGLSGLPGYPNVDAVDTVALRGLVARLLLDPDAAPIYFPAGYPVLELTPNLADHLLGAPLVWWLPFPGSDGLWWLAVLGFVGAAAHHLGRQLGGSHGAGLLAGVGLLSAEAVAREANLHHAPQVLSAGFAPLYLAALLRCLAPRGRPRDGLAAGLSLAGAAISYWYMGLFLAAASLPLLVEAGLRRRLDRPALRRLGLAAAGCAIPAAGPLLWTLSRARSLPLAGAAGQAAAPIPRAAQLAFEHGGDPALLLRFTPADRSSGLALALIAAAAAGWIVRRRRGEPAPWGLLAAAALGWLMALGPYLKWGEQPVLLSGRPIALPFRWLGQLHPALERLSWPERWALLTPLSLAAIAARAPRPTAWALLIGLELLARSQNLPLAYTDLRYERPWEALAEAGGAVLELPLIRQWRSASLPARHARWHGRPVVNPLLLPPGHRAPEAWQAWVRQEALPAAIQALEHSGERRPLSPADGAALRAQGVGAVALDLLAYGVSPARVAGYRALLDPALGPPEDRGALLVWWLGPAPEAPPPPADPERWRAALRRHLARRPPPELETLIQTLWLQP